MTRFGRVLYPNPELLPGPAQDQASQLLPEAVKQSSLGWWTTSEPLPPAEQLLLIGVAVWSSYDLNLLDQLEAVVAGGKRPDVEVFIFDTGAVGEGADFERIFPGIGFVHHSPAVGYFVNGKLVEAECGYAGRKIVARVLGIDEASLHRSSHL